MNPISNVVSTEMFRCATAPRENQCRRKAIYPPKRLRLRPPPAEPLTNHNCGFYNALRSNCGARQPTRSGPRPPQIATKATHKLNRTGGVADRSTSGAPVAGCPILRSRIAKGGGRTRATDMCTGTTVSLHPSRWVAWARGAEERGGGCPCSTRRSARANKFARGTLKWGRPPLRQQPSCTRAESSVAWRGVWSIMSDTRKDRGQP